MTPGEQSMNWNTLFFILPIANACEQLKKLRKCYIRLTPRGKKGYNRCIEWKEPLEERYPNIVTIDVRTTYLERLDLSNLATKFALLNRGIEHPPPPTPPPPALRPPKNWFFSGLAEQDTVGSAKFHP